MVNFVRAAGRTPRIDIGRCQEPVVFRGISEPDGQPLLYHLQLEFPEQEHDMPLCIYPKPDEGRVMTREPTIAKRGWERVCTCRSCDVGINAHCTDRLDTVEPVRRAKLWHFESNLTRPGQVGIHEIYITGIGFHSSRFEVWHSPWLLFLFLWTVPMQLLE